jgi:hypothetical protein
MASARTLGDLLASRRRRRFVGRTSEVELFRVALESAEPEFLLLYLHGPPGIGKTTLLDVYAEIAAEAGASVVRLDGRDLVPSPQAVLQALAAPEVLEEDSIVAGLRNLGPEPVEGRFDRLSAHTHDGRMVIMFDTYERLASLDEWIRTWLVPHLPATALTVLAGRAAPDSAWRTDPAWRELLRVVSLRNLRPDESRQYLHACGVDPARFDQLVELAHGHPLGLSLLADVDVRGGDAAADPLTPDLVGTLLRRFVEIVPSEQHRRALEVCALARVTNEALLRVVLGPEHAHDAFAWLRELSFVETGPEGAYPHDLARDALEADLRWRDPEGYRQLIRGIRGHINRRMLTSHGREQRHAIADVKYMFRRLPGVPSPVDWDPWGQQHPEPAQTADGQPIMDLVLAWEGEESAAITARWWERQPEGFFVVRSQDGLVSGFVTVLNLTRASAEDLAADPGAHAAWSYAQRHGAARPAETVTQSRFIVGREAYQGPSPTLNAVAFLAMQRYLDTRNLAWDFLTLAEPERWDAYFAAADQPRAEGADFSVGGRRYGLFAHDFRQVPIETMLERITERALAGDITPSPATIRPPLLMLSQTEFDDSVRQALRDLHRPDLLARNPLLRTRLLHNRAGDDASAATLETIVGEAIETLREHPRDDKLWRAVERTYLRPAATQERAAAALGLPFSTYRRHLTQGVDRVVRWMWDQEVYGGHK